MLRITPSTSAARADSYYSTADYYTEGQELTGLWQGKGASMLGLKGDVTPKAWAALCNSKDPRTGLPLKARQKQENMVGYDFNFHVPKSVSLLHSLTQDEGILEAFRGAVRDTMLDMETEMLTRVRKAGKNSERKTGNMVWGEFIHTTSRPVDGVPDPHLHAHCFVFSTTWDAVENQWKAGQFRELKRDAPYFQEVFHTRLIKSLRNLGYGIEQKAKGWDVAGFSKPMLDKFSRRTALIESLAKEKGIEDAADKAELGAKTREKKQKQLGIKALQKLWKERLTPAELEQLSQAKRVSAPTADLPLSPSEKEAIWHRSLTHCFERESVVSERELLADVIRRGGGKMQPEEAAQALQAQGVLIFEKEGRRFATTIAIIEEECRLLDFARQGRGACLPLGQGTLEWKRDWLNADQRNAVLHVLNSSDQVMLIRGVAGTGKTSLMKEAVEAIEANGKRVLTFAPSADASRGVLRSKGFANATTVAELLVNQEKQVELRGQVIWVDEASLLGTRTMAKVFDLAKQYQCRVILSGDRKQHNSVERGDALRLLEQEAGLVPAEVREIIRQQGEYLAAVAALSDGRTLEGFDKIDAIGWVHELPDGERETMLARDYLRTVKSGKSVLVVSPTHAEGKLVTDAIRNELKKAKLLAEATTTIPILTNVQLTEGERADPASYQSGEVLVFHQNAKGYERGQQVMIGEGQPIPVQHASKFQVYQKAELSVAPGERLRITRNGFTKDKKHRLNNGALYRLKKLNKEGDLVLDNGWVVAKDYGFLNQGYVVTSYASQGKDVDRIIIAESSKSFRAASREQAYVSLSRGIESAAIYTDSKDALREAIQDGTERMTATELLKSQTRVKELQKHLFHRKRLELQSQAIIGRERENELQRQRELVYD